MLRNLVLPLSAATALVAGTFLMAAPASAATGTVIKAHHVHGHHYKHGHKKRWRKHRGYWGYGPYHYKPHHYGRRCHWKRRPVRVRVWDYYGWHHRVVWRPVRICY